MKTLPVLAVALVLSSTSALAFQEKPSPEAVSASATVKTTALSRFSADENDGSIAQVYSPGTFSSNNTYTANGYPVPVPHHHH
ncbi:hypothetical protein M2O40_002545 [Kluyvera ascorbata]|nr:hypothetical protein [Kluyvera ascorbata]